LRKVNSTAGWNELSDGELRLPFRPIPHRQEHLFVVDIYSALANKHPELHLGWWAFPREKALEAAEVRLIYRPPTEVAVYLVTPHGLHTAHEAWVNPDYCLTAYQQMSLIWYNEQHEPRKQEVVVVVVNDAALLQSYYTAHVEWYTPADTPFGLAFHQRRVAVLERLYKQYIRPGSRVLDIGSSHSFFYLTNGGRWPFSITCIDIDRALMKQAAAERPNFTWAAGAMQRLPFADRSFDAIYAGEVIEHVLDGDAALGEWARVLKPGGTLILTTPNRLRLLNRLNNQTIPISPEHPLEYTYPEIRVLLGGHGFKLLHSEGIYVELLSLWRQRFPYSDPLAGPQPLQRHLRVLKSLMTLGRPLPQIAFDMVFVSRKR
jgi:ubiquinone/menaquinone biosynthesis C-methylase UbiE